MINAAAGALVRAQRAASVQVLSDWNAAAATARPPKADGILQQLREHAPEMFESAPEDRCGGCLHCENGRCRARNFMVKPNEIACGLWDRAR